MGTHGIFYWNELMTRDVDTAREFYEKTLGWAFDAMPMAEGGTYWVAKAGDAMAGGMMDINGPEHAETPTGWFSYISVDDVDARAAAAEAAGGTLLRPIFDVPGVGRIALLRQPDGAHIGWMTPSDLPGG